MPAGRIEGARLRESSEPWASAIRVLPSSRHMRMGPSRRTGLKVKEAETDQEVDDLLNSLQNSDRKRYRDAQFARTSGAPTARRCAALAVEAWDALPAESAENVERTPRLARSAVPVSVDSVSFVEFVESGPHSIGKTKTLQWSGPRLVRTQTRRVRLRSRGGPKL